MDVRAGAQVHLASSSLTFSTIGGELEADVWVRSGLRAGLRLGAATGTPAGGSDGGSLMTLGARVGLRTGTAFGVDVFRAGRARNEGPGDPTTYGVLVGVGQSGWVALVVAGAAGLVASFVALGNTR